MKKTIKPLCLIFASLLAAMSCAGCAGSDEPAGTTATDESAETVTETAAETTILDTLEKHDYGGYTFRILSDKNSDTYFGTSIYSEEMDGEILNDTTFERNKYVEDGWNVAILGEESETVGDTLRAEVMSGGTELPLCYLMIEGVLPLATTGCLMNLYDMDGLNLDAGWWDKDALRSFTFSEGKCYSGNTEMNINILGGANMMSFNADMIANYGLENPYTLVQDHGWTLDKLYAMSKTVASDVNGDGKHDEGDIYGLDGGMGSYAMMLNGAGQTITVIDSDWNMKYNITSDDFMDAAAKIALLLNDKNLSTSVNTQSWANDNYYAGNALFYGICANTMTKMSKEIDFTYGIVPYPLRNEEQENYYSAYDSHVSMFCVSAVQEDAGRTAELIEAMSAYSYLYLTDAYYDTTLVGKCSRDANTEAMLDLIFSSRIYDYSLLFGNYVGEAWDKFYMSVSKSGVDNLASLNEKIGEKVTKNWASTMEALNNL